LRRERIIGVLFVWLLTVGAIVRGGETPATRPATRPAAVSSELRERLKLDPYYEQYIDADGLPILASGKVRPEALLEARYLVDHLLAHRPDVRKALVDLNVRVVVMAATEMTTDVPEHRKMTPKAYWDRRARGLGGRITSCGEENLLRCPGDPYSQESILIHEFSHAIQDKGLKRVDASFDRRVREAYDAAVKSGAWGSSYAASNRHEYFAEGAQAWFDAGRKEAGSSANNGIGTREKLKKADPMLAALCAEVFGDGEWRYMPPNRRKDLEHLAGLDRATLPRFKWPAEAPATRPAESKEPRTK
jgi:hypothetical protein